jgi:hypothetical protein
VTLNPTISARRALALSAWRLLVTGIESLQRNTSVRPRVCALSMHSIILPFSFIHGLTSSFTLPFFVLRLGCYCGC